MASGSDDRRVIVWDVASGQREHEFNGHSAAVQGLAFTPDGSRLYSSSLDRSIFEWDLHGAETLVRTIPAGIPASSPAFPVEGEAMWLSPDGSEIVYQSAEDARFQFHDVVHGTFSEPVALGDNFGITYSTDGARYLTSDVTGVLRIWDTDTGSLLTERATGKPWIASSFTPDGRHVVMAAIDPDDLGSQLELFDATTLESIGQSPLPIGPAARFLAVTPDGRHVIAVVASFSGSDPDPISVVVVDLGTWRIVQSTSVSRDGRHVTTPSPATAGRQGWVSPAARFRSSMR